MSENGSVNSVKCGAIRTTLSSLTNSRGSDRSNWQLHWSAFDLEVAACSSAHPYQVVLTVRLVLPLMGYTVTYFCGSSGQNLLKNKIYLSFQTTRVSSLARITSSHRRSQCKSSQQPTVQCRNCERVAPPQRFRWTPSYNWLHASKPIVPKEHQSQQ